MNYTGWTPKPARDLRVYKGVVVAQMDGEINGDTKVDQNVGIPNSQNIITTHANAVDFQTDQQKWNDSKRTPKELGNLEAKVWTVVGG